MDLHSVHEFKKGTEGRLGKHKWIISTSKLNALRHLHIWPINLVVFQDP
jgi:hypothetical protein